MLIPSISFTYFPLMLGPKTETQSKEEISQNLRQVKDAKSKTSSGLASQSANKANANVFFHGYSLSAASSEAKDRISQYFGEGSYPLTNNRIPLLATKHFLPKGFDQNQKGKISCLRVAVHGWGASGAMFDAMGKAMQVHPHQQCAFIAVDLPGHGNSGAPEDFSYDNPLSYVVALHSLISQLKKEYQVDKISLVGHSMGGGISFLYTLLFPEDIQDLDLMNPWTDKNIPLAKAKSNRKIVENIGPKGLNFLLKLSSGPVGNKYFRDHPEVLAAFSESFDKNTWGENFNYVGHNYVLLKTLSIDWDILARLMSEHPQLVVDLKNKIPVSIFRAKGLDSVVPNRFIYRFAKQLGLSKDDVRPLKGVGHQGPLTPGVLDQILN